MVGWGDLFGWKGLGWLKLDEGYDWGKSFFDFVFRGGLQFNMWETLWMCHGPSVKKIVLAEFVGVSLARWALFGANRGSRPSANGLAAFSGFPTMHKGNLRRIKVLPYPWLRHTTKILLTATVALATRHCTLQIQAPGALHNLKRTVPSKSESQALCIICTDTGTLQIRFPLHAVP